MKRPERIHGFLTTRDGVRVAIRSVTLWQAITGRDAAIKELSESLAREMSECARVKDELGRLRGRRWVRFGTWLRIVGA